MAERIISMKNSNETFGNRIRNLPTGSTVPQSTATPRATKRENVAMSKITHVWKEPVT